MITKKHHLALWLAILLAVGVTAGEKQRILFLGDSITAGYGLGKEQAFPALIQKKLDAEELNYQVINAGVSGDTSSGGLRRVDWVLRQPIHILVLELGANDGLRGLPLDQLSKNLQGIIDKVKAKNPQVRILVAGMRLPPNLGREYASGFEAVFPQVAEANNAALIPFILEGVAGNPELNLPDRIHPTPEGHQILAETVWTGLEPLLK